MCEDNTAICGMQVEKQESFEFSILRAKMAPQLALHTAINGIKFKCCPSGKSFSFLS